MLCVCLVGGEQKRQLILGIDLKLMEGRQGKLLFMGICPRRQKHFLVPIILLVLFVLLNLLHNRELDAIMEMKN